MEITSRPVKYPEPIPSVFEGAILMAKYALGHGLCLWLIGSLFMDLTLINLLDFTLKSWVGFTSAYVVAKTAKYTQPLSENY